MYYSYNMDIIHIIWYNMEKIIWENIWQIVSKISDFEKIVEGMDGNMFWPCRSHICSLFNTSSMQMKSDSKVCEVSCEKNREKIVYAWKFLDSLDFFSSKTREKTQSLLHQLHIICILIYYELPIHIISYYMNNIILYEVHIIWRRTILLGRRDDDGGHAPPENVLRATA